MNKFPTGQMRYVERVVKTSSPEGTEYIKQKILQQQWKRYLLGAAGPTKTWWEDVPTVKDDNE